MHEVNAQQFKPKVTFGFGSTPRLSGGGCNHVKKVPHTERLPWLVNEHNKALITSTSARGVAHTILRRLGHPARALGLVPQILFVLIIFLSHPLSIPLNLAHTYKNNQSKSSPLVLAYFLRPEVSASFFSSVLDFFRLRSAPSS